MELPKVSKKAIVTGVAILALGGAGLLLYLNTRDSYDGTAWVDSNWMYRRTISVANSGSSLTNEDVLVTIDTASLISNNKLQSNCEDIRFTDSDDGSYLDYWIEGNCNTSNTSMWVRIPSLPSGGKNIYVYYGNSVASAGSLSWSGNAILYSVSSCPTGWSRETAFDNRFAYGGTTYGTTGGSSSHNHGGSLSVRTPSNSGGGNVPGGRGYVCGCHYNHQHNVTGTISDATSLPPYITTFVCSANTLSALNNLIFLSDTSIPSGWSRETAFDGKMPYGSASAGISGGSTSHTHTFSNLTTSASQNNYCANIAMEGGSTRDVARGVHTHSVTLSSNGAGSNYPPYKTLLFVTNPSFFLNTSVISMFSVLPPLGWTQYAELDNFFTLGGSAVNLTAQGSATHSHALSFTIPRTGATSRYVAGVSVGFAPDNHTHTASTNLSGSSIPPYITVIYGKRKDSKPTTFGNEEIGNEAPNAPSSLLTNSLTNPGGVTSVPKFSAIFTDPDSSDKATHYQIEVNTNSSFTGTVMWNSGKVAFATPVDNGSRSSDITYAGTTLQWGVTYYWRIKFWDNADPSLEGSWSEVAQFTTNYRPDQPTSLQTDGLVNPTGVGLVPTFSAVFTDTDLVDTATSYQIQVNTSLGFDGTMKWDSDVVTIDAVANGSRIPGVSYGGSVLANGTTYYWRIKIGDDKGVQSDWSAVAQFTTNYVPNQPTTLETSGSVNPTKASLTPSFSAVYTDSDVDDEAISYQIIISKSSSLSVPLTWDSGKSTFSTPVANNTRTPEISYTGDPMSEATTYYWAMRVWDSKDAVSEYSAISQFKTLSSPSSPTGLWTNGSSTPGILPSRVLTFSAIYSDGDGDSAGWYRIQVSSSSSFDTVLFDSGKKSTSILNGERSPDYYFDGSSLLTDSGNTYYWRIKFFDVDDTEGSWSNVASFRDLLVPSSFLFEGVKMEGIKID